MVSTTYTVKWCVRLAEGKLLRNKIASVKVGLVHLEKQSQTPSGVGLRCPIW